MTLFGKNSKTLDNDNSDIFKVLFDNSPDGILVIENEKLILCNDKLVEMFGFDSKEELLSTRYDVLSEQKQPDGFDSDKKNLEMLSLAKRYGQYQFEWEYLRKDRQKFLCYVTFSSIVFKGKKIIYAIISDASDKKRAENDLNQQKEYLEHQVHHDPLTGLPNRSYLMERLRYGIEHAKRQESMLAVFFIDLDNFKQINDSLGHHFGDIVLIEAAKRLSGVIRKEDTLARIGGDEFIIIAEFSEGIGFAKKMGESLTGSLSDPIEVDGNILYVTCSVGISYFPEDGKKAEDLLKYADTAMYDAKNKGRNIHKFYSPKMTQMACSRIAMETDFRQAIEHNEFIAYYQPQIDTSTGEIVGLEALVRWMHPTQGIIMPDKFVPMAEENGTMNEVDRILIVNCMIQFHSWHMRKLRPGSLSVNISIRNLMSADFIDSIKHSMDITGFRPEWLKLEVTEGGMMKNPEGAISRLEEISNMGIKIAVDDFGTGYSSLAYLKRLPVNILKIDRSFIKGLPNDKNDAAIVKATIALAKSLGLDLIAEGTETDAQQKFLVESGCTVMQGYLYGKPMPAVQIEKILVDNAQKARQNAKLSQDTQYSKDDSYIDIISI